MEPNDGTPDRDLNPERQCQDPGHMQDKVNRGINVPVCTLLLVVIAGLTGYIVYDAIVVDTPTKTPCSCFAKRHVILDTPNKMCHCNVDIDDQRINKTSEEFVLSMHGDFFKTNEEQREIEKMFFRDQNTSSYPVCVHNDVQRQPILNTQHCHQVLMTPRQTAPPNRLIKRSPGPYLEPYRYHACCTSRRRFIDPPTAWSATEPNTEYTLVHFPNHRQWFLTHDCWHNIGCHMHCGCRRELDPHKALVYRHGYGYPAMVVRLILIPGSCRCLNGLPPPDQLQLQGFH